MQQKRDSKPKSGGGPCCLEFCLGMFLLYAASGTSNRQPLSVTNTGTLLRFCNHKAFADFLSFSLFLLMMVVVLFASCVGVVVAVLLVLAVVAVLLDFASVDTGVDVLLVAYVLVGLLVRIVVLAVLAFCFANWHAKYIYCRLADGVQNWYLENSRHACKRLYTFAMTGC